MSSLTQQARRYRLARRSAAPYAWARALVALGCATVVALGCLTCDAGAVIRPSAAPAQRALAAAVTKHIWQLASPSAGSTQPVVLGGATSAFGQTDNTHASMDGLDIIANPVDSTCSYLGVYHVNIGGGRFALRLAASRDLQNWRMIADLDSTGAAMGTLRALPGGGFLLAYESQHPTAAGGRIDSSLRLRYYRDPLALVRGAATDERTLPQRLSTSNEGTPDIRTISWHGSLANSVIKIGFHYLDHGSVGKARRLAVDREARGTLAHNRWTVVAERSVDRALTRMGFEGNHGGRRQFAAPAGRVWRVYEAQRHVNDPSSWRLLLYDVIARSWKVLRIKTPNGSTAFANPTLSLLPSPHASGASRLVLTTFVHSAGAGPGEAGEAISYLDL